MRLQLGLSVAAAAALLAPTTAHAQHSITSLRTTIDFTGYTGAGLAHVAGAGQLDSHEWRVSGLSDQADPTQLTAVDGSFTTGDFARGTPAAHVTTGGLYAFNPTAGDPAFG